jgi:hypothetical protein
MTTSFEYEMLGGHKVVNKYVTELITRQKADLKCHMVATSTIAYSPADQFTEYDFSLTKFGLPEPEGVSFSPPRWLWFVLGSVTLLLVLAAFKNRPRNELLPPTATEKA